MIINRNVKSNMRFVSSVLCESFEMFLNMIGSYSYGVCNPIAGNDA